MHNRCWEKEREGKEKKKVLKIQVETPQRLDIFKRGKSAEGK